MRTAAGPYLEALRQRFREEQRQHEITAANSILARYGLRAVPDAAATNDIPVTQAAIRETHSVAPIQPRLFGASASSCLRFAFSREVRTAPIEAVQHVRKMRGGSQAHLLRCSDGGYYVTKFQGNPQHTRILANEMFATRAGLWLSLPMPAVAI